MNSPNSSKEDRIISLLPSATEILCAVGCRSRIVACTHECDYPPGISDLPHVTRSLLPPNLTSEEIDACVAKAMRSDEHTIYALDEALVASLRPRFIVTQSLCDVCAVPERKVTDVACTLPSDCRVVRADPSRLDELFDSIQAVGDAVGAPNTSETIVGLRARLARVEGLTRGLPSIRVCVLEWPSPPYAPGHWVPDQIESAGGTCALGQGGKKSERVTWEKLTSTRPDVIVLAFCGFDLRENEERLGEVVDTPEWKAAARGARVIASDANAFFSRPGPRLIDGVELLAYVLHGKAVPELAKPTKGQMSELLEGQWVDLSTPNMN